MGFEAATSPHLGIRKANIGKADILAKRRRNGARDPGDRHPSRPGGFMRSRRAVDPSPGQSRGQEGKGARQPGGARGGRESMTIPAAGTMGAMGPLDDRLFSRVLLDEDRGEGPPSSSREAGGILSYTLNKLCIEIARSVSRLGRVYVEGEVVKPRVLESGWMFFTLSDRGCNLQVACAPERARRAEAASHGARVGVVGTVQFAARSGQLRFMAEEVVPVGIGDIEAQIARSRERLRSEGILDRPRKAIPRLPNLIGVLCGADAAVIGDIASVVADRFPGYPVTFHQVVVSGPGAVQAILGGLEHLASTPGVDVVIVARGGGDPASLFPFSDEQVCRAIASMPVPVVTAIGHERDHPLCDEVSDLACNTPSLAAVRVVPDEVALRRAADELLAEARSALSDGAAEAVRKLCAVDLRGSLDMRLERASARVAAVRLDDVLGSRTAAAALRLEGLSRTLEALDPMRVLDRGYAIVRNSSGAIVRRVAQVAPGDGIDVSVSDGAFQAVVA
jgi:exodeoxyribonuclease VII large subunit